MSQKKIIVAFLTLFLLLTLAPFFVHAAEEPLVPCDNTLKTDKATGESTVAHPCGVCEVFTLSQKVLNFIYWKISAPIAALMFLWAGLLIVSGGVSGNTGSYQTGWKIMKNTLLGLAIVFVAWLAIDTIIKLAQGKVDTGGPAQIPQSSGFGPWNEVKCPATKPIVFAPPPKPPPPTDDGGGGGGGGGAGCTPVTAGPCSVSSLQGTFGANATAASTVCKKESAGIPDSESRIDTLPNSGNRPFSIGLFQINLTANTFACEGISMNCPSAFRGKNKDAVIINEQLYTQCRTAAKNASCNIQKAKQLYDGRGGRWTDWLGTAKDCGLPL